MKQNVDSQEFFETKFKGHWKYLPSFETNVKLSVKEKQLQLSADSIAQKDDSMTWLEKCSLQ